MIHAGASPVRVFTKHLKRGQENFPDDMKLFRMNTVKYFREISRKR